MGSFPIVRFFSPLFGKHNRLQTIAWMGLTVLGLFIQSETLGPGLVIVLSANIFVAPVVTPTPAQSRMIKVNLTNVQVVLLLCCELLSVFFGTVFANLVFVVSSLAVLVKMISFCEDRPVWTGYVLYGLLITMIAGLSLIAANYPFGSFTLAAIGTMHGLWLTTSAILVICFAQVLPEKQ